MTLDTIPDGLAGRRVPRPGHVLRPVHRSVDRLRAKEGERDPGGVLVALPGGRRGARSSTRSTAAIRCSSSVRLRDWSSTAATWSCCAGPATGPAPRPSFRSPRDDPPELEDDETARRGRSRTRCPARARSRPPGRGQAPATSRELGGGEARPSTLLGRAAGLRRFPSPAAPARCGARRSPISQAMSSPVLRRTQKRSPASSPCEIASPRPHVALIRSVSGRPEGSRENKTPADRVSIIS